DLHSWIALIENRICFAIERNAIHCDRHHFGAGRLVGGFHLPERSIFSRTDYEVRPKFLSRQKKLICHSLCINFPAKPQRTQRRQPTQKKTPRIDQILRVTLLSFSRGLSLPTAHKVNDLDAVVIGDKHLLPI